jgi:hypothetical protein
MVSQGARTQQLFLYCVKKPSLLRVEAVGLARYQSPMMYVVVTGQDVVVVR